MMWFFVDTMDSVLVPYRSLSHERYPCYLCRIQVARYAYSVTLLCTSNAFVAPAKHGVLIVELFIIDDLSRDYLSQINRVSNNNYRTASTLSAHCCCMYSSLSHKFTHLSQINRVSNNNYRTASTLSAHCCVLCTVFSRLSVW
jgi:hypothetical protein